MFPVPPLPKEQRISFPCGVSCRIDCRRPQQREVKIPVGPSFEWAGYNSLGMFQFSCGAAEGHNEEQQKF